MNRVVISVPRVLDSAVVTIREKNVIIDTSNIPPTYVAPYKVRHIHTLPTETQMQNTTTTRLSTQTNCSRVTADIIMPVVLALTDANNQDFEINDSITESIDIVLFIPNTAAFPYELTSEAVMDCTNCNNHGDTTTVHNATFRILTRVTAVTDLLIPCYGYAPINCAENYQSNTNENFLNQPLFPTGKIY